MKRYSPSSRFAGLAPSCRQLFAALLLATAGTAGAQGSGAATRLDIRTEVGRPLQAAQAALGKGAYKDALAHVAEAEAVPARNGHEAYAIARIKGSAALGAGDNVSALGSFEAALKSPLLPRAERPLMLEVAVKLALKRQEWPRAQRWLQAYFDEGGNQRELRMVYGQVLSMQGDHAGTARELRRVEAEDDAAGRVTPALTLRVLAVSLKALGDEAGLARVMGKLAAQSGK